MKWYVVRVDDSDGNDNIVVDTLVEAESKEAAVNKVCDTLEARAKERGIELESDGGFGYFYGCACERPDGEEDIEECSHGGVIVSEPENVEEYETHDEAYASIPVYHCREEI